MPKGWWHYVEAMTDAASVNIWSPHPADTAARVEEAVVRCTVGLFARGNAAALPEGWLNPGELAPGTAADWDFLALALRQQPSGAEFEAVDAPAAGRRLLRALTSPAVAAAVAAELTAG